VPLRVGAWATKLGIVRRTRGVSRLARLWTIALLVLSGLLTAGAGSASAQGSGYYVTFVALSCPSYSDIFANRARNDILESLKNLGPDTQYTNGELINPTAEGIPPQSNCTPLPGWEFTLGRGIEGRAVTGPWGSLSKVTNPFPGAPIVTQDHTPLLNQTGSTSTVSSLPEPRRSS
jgi:hypothetical protein